MTLVRLTELGAMTRAYPPGKRVKVHVLAGNAPKSLKVGDDIELAEDVRRPHGARARGRVVGMAWVVEVELPDEDAAPLVDPGQGTLEAA